MTSDVIGIENDQSQIIREEDGWMSDEILKALKLARDAFTGMDGDLPHVSSVRAAVVRAEQLVAEQQEALRLLAAEDARNDKVHDLLETIREQIRLEIAPEHRPEGLFTNIQNVVYAFRGRTRLINDDAIVGPLGGRADE